MEEIVEIDGRQYRLSYGRPITLEERSQTIENIRRSPEHNAYMQQIGQLKKLDSVRKIGTLSAGMKIS